MISDFCQKQNYSEEAKAIKELKAKGELIEDSVVNSLMLTRLVQDDIKKRGVILDGYPSNENQALFLEENAKIYLNLVVVLKASDSVCR